MMEGTSPHHASVVQHGGALPDLTVVKVNLYVTEPAQGTVVENLADLVRQSFQSRTAPALV